jgi:serine/threonine protein kinase
LKSCPECYSEYEDSVDKCVSDGTALRKIERDPLIGTRLADRYEVVSVVGRGGMGVVYKVRQEQMDRFMAVKMLHSHMVAEPEAVKRFYREAKTVSQVRHHHIITLYDFGMSKLGQPFLVMDYLEGTSLKSVLKDEGPVPIERVEHIYSQVVDALASAHSVELVHRDLKPENIMLSKSSGVDDWVTLVDFGLSKLRDPKANNEENYHITKIGDVCGSPPYMSPEQCLSSQAVDPRSDIYSLGICVYETLSAKLPFTAKSAIEMLDAHLYATPIPFNQIAPEFKMCSEITNVLNKALQKDPDRRHQTVQEFGNEFREACRRDALKFRTMKHRAEMSSYQDLQSEAKALASSAALDAISDEQLKQAEIERELAIQSAKKQTFVDWLVAKFSKPTPVADNDVEDVSEEKCPFCQTAITPGIKFCLNCQHKFATQTPKQIRGGNSQPHAKGARPGKMADTVDVRRRTKASFNHVGLTGPQKAMTLMLLIIVGVGVAVSLNFNVVKSEVAKIMTPQAVPQTAVETPAAPPPKPSAGHGKRRKSY